MKTTRTFEMNGKSYTSMMDIARELGVKRVYPRDFDKYGIVETTGKDNADKTSEPVAEEKSSKPDTKKSTPVKKNTETKKSVKESETDNKTSDTSEEPKIDKRFTRKLGTPEQIQEVQNKVSQMTIVEFNDYIKHFSLDALIQMAETAGVKTWESIDNEPIRKMRLLMEIKGHYFPNDKTPVKPSSAWKNYELDVLLKLAKQKKLKFKTSDDVKIQRMWVVVALNKAGLTPDDLEKKNTKKKKEETAND